MPEDARCSLQALLDFGLAQTANRSTTINRCRGWSAKRLLLMVARWRRGASQPSASQRDFHHAALRGASLGI
jgi:hypothetical protein